MGDLALNNPVVRQDILRQRLLAGTPLIAAELAQEFEISLDTMRRDLMVLEEEGLLQRVRGGAVPVRPSSSTFSQRRKKPPQDCSKLVPAAVPYVKQGMTVIIDGGTTLTHLAELLPPLPDLFVITPSPTVATALIQKEIETFLLGGRISRWGAIAVGSEAEHALSNLTADLCFLGICGLDDTFGLSADDAEEASLKRAMAKCASDNLLVCSEAKLGQRGRHRVLLPDQISVLVTDAEPSRTQSFKTAGVETVHV